MTLHLPSAETPTHLSDSKTNSHHIHHSSSLPSTGRRLRGFSPGDPIELSSYKRARKSAIVVGVKSVSTHSICNWPCGVLIFHPAFESPFAVPKLTTVGTSTPSEEIETSLNHPRTCVVMVIIISNNGALNFLGFGDGAFSDQPSIHHMKSNMIVFVFRLPRPQREYIYERTFEIHNRLN